MSGNKILMGLTLIIFCLGFRVLSKGNSWDVDRDNPKIWISICQSLYPVVNDLPYGDPLYRVRLNYTNVTQSILDDYNQIEPVYIELADLLVDPEYNPDLHNHRVIDICSGEMPGEAAGYSEQIWKDDRVVGCKIRFNPDLVYSAKSFIGVITHEMGHCLGLDHPQDTVHALMSYYHGAQVVRLQTDDKMGLSYLYPVNSDKPQLTFGLSCDPR